jgi:YVTN family beta-propeller protein
MQARRIGRAVLLGALCALAHPGPVRSAGEADGAQIVVYVEVPPNVVEKTLLRLASLTLQGASGRVPIGLLVRELDSRAISGRQVRLAEEVVPPGLYVDLEMCFELMEAHLGPAAVRPAVPPGGVRIPLSLELSNGGGALVVLRWSPEAIDPEEEFHRPRLEVADPEVPPLGSLAFVTNEGSDNVSVVDRFSQKIVDVIRVGEGPRGITASRREQWLYVVNSSSNDLTVIDARTRRTIKRATLTFGDEPIRVALSPDESELYVLNRGSNMLSVLDARSLQESSRIVVGEGPRAMAVDPVTGFIYVASELSRTVLIVDPGSEETVASLSVEVSPAEILLDATNRRLYVSGADQRKLSIVDIETLETEERMNLCSPAVGLAYNPRSRQLYASLEDCRELAILSTVGVFEIGSIGLDDPPGLISLDPEYGQLLTILPTAGELAFYSVNSKRLTGIATVGKRPHMVVVPR